MPRERLPIGELGSINHTKLEAGGWLAYAYYRDAYGKRRKLSATGPTKPKATSALKAKAPDLTPTGSIGNRTLVGELAQRWAASYKSKHAGTVERYRQTVERVIAPDLAHLTVAEFTTSRAQEYIDRITRERGPARARQVRSILTLIMDMAVADNALPWNPMKNTKPPAVEATRFTALTAKDISDIRGHIIEWGQQHNGNGPKRRWQLLLDFTDLMAATGARPSEVRALRWKDIDLQEGVITFAGTMIRTNGSETRQPFLKGKDPVRVLKLHPFALDVLLMRFMREGGGPDAPVFPSEAGGWLPASSLGRLWRAARAPLGESGTSFESVELRDYRRAVGTALAESAGLTVAARGLGHRQQATTERHYVGAAGVVDVTEYLGGLLGRG